MKRILIVDDSEGIRESFRLILETFCDITTADDGAQGEELFENAHDAGTPFDLVISDIEMPRMTGIELVSWIKNHSPQTPCILMSGRIDPKMHQADLFMKKPVGMVELRDIVAQTLDSRRTAQS